MKEYRPKNMKIDWTELNLSFGIEGVETIIKNKIDYWILEKGATLHWYASLKNNKLVIPVSCGEGVINLTKKEVKILEELEEK